MKNLAKITLLAAGLASVFPFVNAASTDAPAPAPAPDATSNGAVANHPKRQGMMRHRRAIARHIAHKLNLNADQITQLKTIRSSTRTSLMSIRSNTNLTPDQKKSQAREVLKSSRTQMRALLTPEQQAKLDEMKNRAWERQGGF